MRYMVLEAHKELWERLQNFKVDPDHVSLSFVSRLARENGWSRRYSQRVFDEYRKFAFLAMVSGHMCTPSDQVDQAWHLHLTYTRSYWEEFCGKVLPRPLHHDPTKGGAKENDKYDDWYNRTLESYRRVFGHEPPADIWPASCVRFGEDLHYVRVNTKRNWILPRKRVPKLALAAVAWSVLVVAGCSAQADPAGGLIVGIGIAAFVVIAGVAGAANYFGNGGGGRKRRYDSYSSDGGSDSGVWSYSSDSGGSSHHSGHHGHGGHGHDGGGHDGGGHGGHGGDSGGSDSGGGDSGGGCGGGGCGGGGCGGG